MADRNKETSRALTEVRTVLSRAQTALETLDEGPSEWVTDHDENGRYIGSHRECDPEQTEMIDALRFVVVTLSRWRSSKGKRR